MKTLSNIWNELLCVLGIHRWKVVAIYLEPLICENVCKWCGVKK